MVQLTEKIPCLCSLILKFLMESFRLGKQNNYKIFCLEMTHKSEVNNIGTKRLQNSQSISRNLETLIKCTVAI